MTLGPPKKHKRHRKWCFFRLTLQNRIYEKEFLIFFHKLALNTSKISLSKKFHFIHIRPTTSPHHRPHPPCPPTTPRHIRPPHRHRRHCRPHCPPPHPCPSTPPPPPIPRPLTSSPPPFCSSTPTTVLIQE